MTQPLTVAGSAMVVGIMQCATWAVMRRPPWAQLGDYAWPSVRIHAVARNVENRLRATQAGDGEFSEVLLAGVRHAALC